MNPKRLKASCGSSPSPEVCFSTFQRSLHASSQECHRPMWQQTCLFIYHMFSGKFQSNCFTLSRAMDPFCFESTKFRLSSHPAWWAGVGGEGRRFRWWLHGLSTLETNSVEQIGFSDTFPNKRILFALQCS